MRRLALLAGLSLAGTPAAFAQQIDVWPAPGARPISEAIARAPRGALVVVHAGVYREPAITIDKPIVLEGRDRPVLDGTGTHGLLVVSGDSVTVRGFVFRNTGSSFVEDRAAVRIAQASACTVEDNRFERTFFGVYLSNVTDCRIERNELRASGGGESSSGNGIHLWSSRAVTITDNRITGHRDGIYFEFVHDSRIRGNVSERNVRYGLHFMYSDGCRYEDNTFRANGAGVAVMYTKHVQMTGNRFEENWGPAAYGLLLKEITDSRLERNVFRRNTTALLADGANRLVAEHNDFEKNGWAIRLDANTERGRVEANNFSGNTFDVTSNGQSHTTTLAGNYWDDYRGYDLNRDGVGDVAHRPVRLFSVLVEHHEPALILLRSAFVHLLDLMERALPSLTPHMLVDAAPSMRRIP
jgi:nitrous oxidase accessory protein